MKVLWFSNTPAAGDEMASSRTGGWLKSLDKAIQDKVELHVAFYDRHYPAEYTLGRTTYHQIAPQKKLELVKRRILLATGKNPDIHRYLEVIRKVKPDIIHIHGTELRWIELARYTDIPVVLSVQGIVTAMNHKYFTGISRHELPCCGQHVSFYKKLLRGGRVERENLRYVNNIIGRTDWDRRCYSVLAPHASYYVCNEILRDGFYNAVWSEPVRNDGRLIVHTTTSSLLFKGLETVCEAVSELERIGVDVEWRVAGVDTDCEIVRAIRRRMGGRFPGKGIILLGSLDEAMLIKTMLEADVYVSPSHQDNSPNSLCEAMLLGMPCISTYAGGSGTILKDGVTGVLVQDGDPWAMAGAVLELARDRKLAQDYAVKARAAAVLRHDKQRIVEDLVDIYNSLL